MNKRSAKEKQHLVEESNRLFGCFNPSNILATLHIDYVSSPRMVKSIEEALLPETGKLQRAKLNVSTAKVRGNRARICLDFASDDLTTLRASLNTNLRLLNLAIKTLDLSKSLANSSS